MRFTNLILYITKIMGDQAALGEGLAVVDLTGHASPYTPDAGVSPPALTPNRAINIAGALTADYTLILPNSVDTSTVNFYRIRNLTTGAFSVIIQGTAGAGGGSVTLPSTSQGKACLIELDNTTVRQITPLQ